MGGLRIDGRRDIVDSGCRVLLTDALVLACLVLVSAFVVGIRRGSRWGLAIAAGGLAAAVAMPFLR